MFKELHRGGGTSVRGVIGRSGARIGAKAHSLHPTLIMVRLRLQCVMSILLGSTGMLIAQQQQPLPQGRLPRTAPVPLTSTQPSNPNTAPQQSPQTAIPQQPTQATPAAQGVVRIA